MGVEDFSGFGWRDAALGADQELLVEFVFERGDLLTECRLRNVQHFCCLSQTADVDDFYKVFQSS